MPGRVPEEPEDSEDSESDDAFDDIDDLFVDDEPDEDFELDDLGLPQETDEWTVLREDTTAPSNLAQELTALPWQLRAEIPALQMFLPAVLDPTAARSLWRVTQPPSEPRIEVLLRLGSVEVRATLDVVLGEPGGLRIGRDVLGGRILVQS